MKNKQFARWAIVLFLLAALPGLTAVMAQGQGPAGKAPLPAVTEPGESVVAYPWHDDESEPNNSFAAADSFTSYNVNSILGGTIGYAGDVDYWAFDWSPDFSSMATNIALLVDIDARSNGSLLDSVICLYSDDLIELACNDDTDTRDSLLYYNLQAERRYYLRVSDYDGRGDANYTYQVFWSSPLLISAAAANLGTGNIAGIPFQAGDILADSRFSNVGHKWVMLFDLSDLGVKGNVTNLASGWRNSDYLLLGFAANVRLPGVAPIVTPWDVVTFDPSRIGPRTEGTFGSWWAGKDHGLTTAAERIDAIDWPDWNGTTRLYISTTGKASVPNGTGGTLVLPDDEIALWHSSDNGWGDVGIHGFPGMAGEDLIGLSVVEGCSAWPYLVVIQGSGVLGSSHFAVNQNHIASLELGWGAGDDGFLWWSGWNYKMDAIENTLYQYWPGCED